MKNPITITVSHNIFLTKDERYKLANGESIEVVGVSVPVWFHGGKTSEPAVEVFCKYRLSSAKVPTPITNYEEGYLIALPQANEKEKHTVTDLKDIKEDGCEYMHLRQAVKTRKGRKNYDILHFVEIKTIEELNDTLTYN